MTFENLTSLQLLWFLFKVCGDECEVLPRISQYKSAIPSFWTNRLRILVLHCIERIFAAKDIKSQHIECTDISKGTFKIKSQSQDGSWYLLSFGDSETMCRCGCPDWQKWWLPCKHFIAIFNTYPAWQWESLSSLYLNSPFFSLDEDLITKLQSPCNMTSSLTAEEPLTTPHLEEPQEQLNISEKHSLVDQCISDAKSPPTLDVETGTRELCAAIYWPS